jgi:hypothetical protein
MPYTTYGCLVRRGLSFELISKTLNRCGQVRFAPKNGHRLLDRPCPLCADIVAKVFLGCPTKILRAADAFCARRCEGTISVDPKSITDLRSGAEQRRSSREVQSSTFARFLGLFDFRLLQQNLPIGEAPSEVHFEEWCGQEVGKDLAASVRDGRISPD